ncbi:type VII secretion protein EssA [Lactococcus ileimucosae]|uniref:Type VII secretion protein EssA n=1 Tax=Lactococcus ileimucosae TaxID=2941329 RepID=A0ABV4D4T0_9LACT
MKKHKFLWFFGVLFFLTYSSVSVQGDSDGSLQLQSEMITNQSGGGASVSEFGIRSQLFSTPLYEKEKEKEKQEAETLKHVQAIDFNKNSQNKLYKTNVQNVRTELFKDYKQANVASTSLNTEAKTKGMLVLLIVAIPLMVLTGFVARRFARRKRKR